jgi:predicted AlkP superfamily phosphohydrolase/phosphomutase
MDGASMELVLRMVDDGHMPNLKKVIQRGVHKPMIGVFPTLTPPGWTALMTGAWPGTHGVMDFNIRKVGAPLDKWVHGIDTRVCKAEYLWNTFERAGKKPILVKFEMSWPPTVTKGVQFEGTGPGIANYHQITGYHNFVAGKRIDRTIGGPTDPIEVDPSAAQTGNDVDPVMIVDAEDWKQLPDSHLPYKEVELTLKMLKRTTPHMARGIKGEPVNYFGIIYATTQNVYNRVRICRSRDASDTICDLGVGEWSDWWVDTFVLDGVPLEGTVRMKLLSLSPNADMFELFVPQIWPTGGEYAYPDGLAEEITMNIGNFLQNPARDALGVIDDDTYFELLDFHHNRISDIVNYLTRERVPDWDALFVETHASDYANHFFIPQADRISGAVPDVIQRCQAGVTRTYASIDRMIGNILTLVDDDTVVVFASDHGGTPSKYRAIDIDQVLEETGFLVYIEEDGLREIDWTHTRAKSVGLINIFINLEGREPTGIVKPEDYETTQLEIIAALHTYRDKETGQYPFSLALTRSDAEMINMVGELYGDVVFALRPEFDAAHGKHMPSSQLGIGSQHSTFVMAGPGVRKGIRLHRQVRVVDVAPTLCYLLGVPMPKNVEGGVIYEALVDPDWHLRT